MSDEDVDGVDVGGAARRDRYSRPARDDAPDRERDGRRAVAGCLLVIGTATLVAVLIWVAVRG